VGPDAKCAWGGVKNRLVSSLPPSLPLLCLLISFSPSLSNTCTLSGPSSSVEAAQVAVEETGDALI